MKTYRQACVKFNRFWNRITIEWKIFTDGSYFEKEDLKKSSITMSDSILTRDIECRIELLNNINKRVIEESKLEMKYHFDRGLLFEKTINNYENRN